MAASPHPAARSRRYPLATIAAYGPNTSLATKLVVSVLERARDRQPVVMHTFVTEATDIRQDPEIAAEMTAFLRRHGVKDTVAYDRIIGCPHQEGIDYPMGRTCPQCPFWAAIDRFTHEPIITPPPTMSPAAILAALSEDTSSQPLDALASADGHREALVDPLLAVLDRGIADPSGVSRSDASLFAYALYLFAKWRDPRAYSHVIRWLSLPEEQPFDIAGDIVTQDGGRILAAVCDGDLAPIKALILNRDADEFGRSAGVIALALLVAWGEVPRAPVVDCFLWLARAGLEREHSMAWDSLASEAADIEALTVFPELRRAYDEELIDPQYIGREELDDVEHGPPGRMLDATRNRYPPIEDVARATSWWSQFGRHDRRGTADHAGDDDRGDHEHDVAEPQEPYRAPPKIGRNDPCPCGSGKKYKKCCGQ